MARHAHRRAGLPGRAPRPLRWLAVALIWLAGVAAGLFTLVAGAARVVTCSAHAPGLACRGTGTVFAVLLLVAVVAVVTSATVLTLARTSAQLAALTVVAVAVLVGLLAGARSLLATA